MNLELSQQRQFLREMILLRDSSDAEATDTTTDDSESTEDSEESSTTEAV